MPTNRLPFLDPRHKPQVIIVYLFVLFLVSIFTWDLLTSAESFVTSTANQLSAIIYDQPIGSTNQDSSFLEITTSPDLNVLVKYPGGGKAGDTNDDIRFTSANHTTIVEKQVYRETGTSGSQHYIWQLTSKQPPIGNYQLVLSAKVPGTYPLTVRLVSRDGLYTKEFDKQISLYPGTKLTYFLKYHKDVVYRSQLKQKLSLSYLLLSPFRFLQSLTATAAN